MRLKYVFLDYMFLDSAERDKSNDFQTMLCVFNFNFLVKINNFYSSKSLLQYSISYKPNYNLFIYNKYTSNSLGLKQLFFFRYNKNISNMYYHVLLCIKMYYDVLCIIVFTRVY